MERVILIGIDGADYKITKKLIEQGKLKNLSSIKEKGKFSKLMSTIPPLSPAAWTSIFTGVPPHKHGIWGFLKQKPNEYFYKPVTSKDRKVKAIWNRLSERNRKSIIVNVPFSYPPEKIKGIMITGLGSPGKESNFVYPPSLKEHILKQFPDFNVDLNEGKLEQGADIYELEDNIIKTEQAHVDLFLSLINENEWQFSAIVLRSLDVIQHFAFDNQKFIEKHYERVDKLVGDILTQIEPDVNIIVVSDHGFRPVSRRFYVNNWLEKEGYLKVTKSGTKNWLLRLGIDAEKIRGIMKKIGMDSIVKKIEYSNLTKHLLKVVPSSSHQYLFNTEWRQTKAFFYRGSNGLIKLNLTNREPLGCVTEEEAKKLAEEIKNKLLNVTDPKTETTVFRNVFLKEELGITAPDFPELILVPNTPYEIMDYNARGNIFADIPNRPGEHGLYGIFMSNFEPPIHVEAVWDVGKLIRTVLKI